jgi:ferric-dicitrate binding protein FerR (iron transport regulator)
VDDEIANGAETYWRSICRQASAVDGGKFMTEVENIEAVTRRNRWESTLSHDGSYRTRVRTPALWTVALALGFFSDLPSSPGGPPILSDGDGNWSSYTTQVGSHRNVALRDGISVDLNTDTRLQMRFAGSSPEAVLDHGEAFFQVKHNPQRLFTVRVGRITISAIATSFDVYRRADGRISISVMEGRVRIEDHGLASDAPISALPAIVSAGEVITVGKDTVVKEDATKVDGNALASKPAWIDGQLIFNGDTLLNIVNELNRYNIERLVIVDASIEQLRIGGSCNTTDLEQFVRALQALYGIRAVHAQEGGSTVIRLSLPGRARGHTQAVDGKQGSGTSRRANPSEALSSRKSIQR